MNPIAEQNIQRDAEKRKQEDFRYPFRVVCVFLDSNNNDFPIINEVQDYCKNHNLIFSARKYDTDRHDVDVQINRLPAFHIYDKKYHQETQYFDTNPVHMIQKHVWAYEDKLRAQERRRKEHQEQWNKFMAMFTLPKRRSLLNLEASLSKTK